MPHPKKASITSTFDELTCQALIGTQMQGSIQKVECEPYEYTVKDTGEVIVLHHRFVYSPTKGKQRILLSNTQAIVLLLM